MHTLTLEGLQAKGKAHQVYKERQERGSPMGELNLLRELCFQSLSHKMSFMCPRQAKWAVTWVASAMSGRLLSVEKPLPIFICANISNYTV